MASQSLISFFFFPLFLWFSPPIISPSGDFGRRLDPKVLGMKEEKLTHFKLYWQDIASSKNPSSVTVIKSPGNSSTEFGRTVIFDNPLTLGPELSSKLVGKAQGFNSWVSQTELALLHAQNFVFTEGKYNGSSITILGRNAFMNHVREMPVVGGSGVFRFARGYAEATTYSMNDKGDAIVEYNVYVFHY